MITRETGISLTFTCTPLTSGYTEADHTCVWRFSGSTETLTGTSVSHAWDSAGVHTAEVVATCNPTGRTAKATMQVLITPSAAVPPAPIYVLIDKPAAARSRSAIYYKDTTGIRKWNPDTGADTLFSALPTGVDGYTFSHLEISDTYCHVHYLTTVTASANGYTGNSLVIKSYRRALDLSDQWTLYGDWGWNEWFGPGYNDIYATGCRSFAGGKSFFVADFRSHADPTVLRGARNIITGEGSIASGFYSAVKKPYYASLNRAYIGNLGTDAYTRTIDAARNFEAHNYHSAWINRLGSVQWLYYQSGTVLHVAKASLVNQAWVYSEATKSGCTLSTKFPPVPFATKSLLLLESDASNGANAVWWTGTDFVDEWLGNADRSSLATVKFTSALAFARTGQVFSLTDGSILHTLADPGTLSI